MSIPGPVTAEALPREARTAALPHEPHAPADPPLTVIERRPGWHFLNLRLGGAFYCGIRACNRTHKALKANPHDRQARWAYTVACGAEGALVVWAFGAAFLSLETFEPPYILAMLAIQLWSIVRLPATDGIEKGSIPP